MKHTGSWRIALVGAGNVAWHLGHILSQKGVIISQVLGRNASSVQLLANELQVKETGMPGDLDADSDACIICVSDDAIQNVIERTNPGNCLMIHTAGSVNLEIFKGYAVNYGVLYPLQTLTINRPVSYSGFPVLIEANSEENLERVESIADKISGHVIRADSDQRAHLHLAAVFAGNFTNHMFSLAEKIVIEQGLSFELLNPLMEEITAKALSLSPRLAQTGPASRGNTRIMDKHFSMLQDHPDLQKIYRMISDSIINMKK